MINLRAGRFCYHWLTQGGYTRKLFIYQNIFVVLNTINVLVGWTVSKMSFFSFVLILTLNWKQSCFYLQRMEILFLVSDIFILHILKFL